QYDWEETTYQLLAKNFGFKVNSEPMLRLSQALPLKVLRRHSSSPIQLEALLFGQAGLLENPEDDYSQQLQKEYQFLARKYNLPDAALHASHWKFLRMRPANFPTVRIAQMATLLGRFSNLFSLFVNHPPKDLLEMLQIRQSDYWQQHYHLAKEAKGPVPGLGTSSIENIIINTVAPLLVCYAREKSEERYTEKALEFLEHTRPENNKLLRPWQDLGVPIQSAYDSQALTGLYQNYCQRKQCLQCSIGLDLMKRG
ncbi:MAG: DUF2851 family protein, partial [Bacteroidia bacterium]|nr:DUF2851 family protein [Bacteroidia bacterium]